MLYSCPYLNESPSVRTALSILICCLYYDLVCHPKLANYIRASIVISLKMQTLPAPNIYQIRNLGTNNKETYTCGTHSRGDLIARPSCSHFGIPSCSPGPDWPAWNYLRSNKLYFFTNWQFSVLLYNLCLFWLWKEYLYTLHSNFKTNKSLTLSNHPFAYFSQIHTSYDLFHGCMFHRHHMVCFLVACFSYLTLLTNHFSLLVGRSLFHDCLSDKYDTSIK